MRSSGRFFKQALECMTQCVLLPGVELNFDDVLNFYKKNFDIIGVRVKSLGIKRSSLPREW